MGLSDTGPMCTGGLGPGGEPVPGEQEGCTPHRRILHPKAHGSSRRREQPTKGDISGHLLWHCLLLYLCQVLLVPHPESWAGAELRHLVPSLALLLMFMKPPVHVCLSFPPTRSHLSRRDTTDPEHPVVKTEAERGEEKSSGAGDRMEGVCWEPHLLHPCCSLLWAAMPLELGSSAPPVLHPPP